MKFIVIYKRFDIYTHTKICHQRHLKNKTDKACSIHRTLIFSFILLSSLQCLLMNALNDTRIKKQKC